jgi:hypothetical protein
MLESGTSTPTYAVQCGVMQCGAVKYRKVW